MSPPIGASPSLFMEDDMDVDFLTQDQEIAERRVEQAQQQQQQQPANTAGLLGDDSGLFEDSEEHEEYEKYKNKYKAFTTRLNPVRCRECIKKRRVCRGGEGVGCNWCRICLKHKCELSTKGSTKKARDVMAAAAAPPEVSPSRSTRF